MTPAPKLPTTRIDTTPASFQRERNPYGLGVTTQANSQLFAASHPGANIRVCWAAPGNGDGGVAEYRAMGYRVVQPKDVEEMVGGQYAPHDRDIGVYVEVDKTSDRIEGRGGMVLMYTSNANYNEILADQKKMSDMWYTKTRRKETDERGTEFTVEESVKHESLADIVG